MSLEVKLISHTEDPVRIVAAAARLCYSPVGAVEILERLDGGKARELIGKLTRSGHMSPFEHASFTFAVDGLSRVASHQLVRHRIASFSQQSQRYVDSSGGSCVVPPSVAASKEALDLFQRAVQVAEEAYRQLCSMGVPREDARFLLPHGFSTRMVFTMNARELHHFFSLRLCRRAQWEIRLLAVRMLGLVRAAAPELFELAGPSCVTAGRCSEEMSCNRPFSSVEELLCEYQ
ncbi:thymidylate synthase, flavin-dependent [Thermanaerovibrio velox DSM 12556]|uniref:Flavin-dependent thymidylate synthase n=1 Tax=Thermanaerovibrio velox DSM 12556 TaxID=926567 RepID=H0UR92_9BACT|nr:FAD-dependent thymidylate synthase [Thermanaerovibrio velox]EHM09848.1 thymidylate synthase, flavin-dependent [Thermanaerovibrio velox DSM 12556]